MNMKCWVDVIDYKIRDMNYTNLHFMRIFHNSFNGWFSHRRRNNSKSTLIFRTLLSIHTNSALASWVGKMIYENCVSDSNSANDQMVNA